MPRIKRKKISFTEESANELLQEIYNDTHNIRANIKRLFTKWETKVKEMGEVHAVGDQIIKLINAEAKNQDQKITLLKFLKDVVFENKSSKTSSTEEDEGTLSDQRRNDLIDMVTEGLEKQEKNRN